MRGATPEEWWYVLKGYFEAFLFGAEVWLPGSWALTGAIVTPVVAFLLFRVFQNRFAPFRIAFAPFAGGFAGGYFQAMSVRAGSCPDRGGVQCIISAPAEELAYIILASMLCVVFVYLCLPGRNWDRRLIRGGDSFDFGD